MHLQTLAPAHLPFLRRIWHERLQRHQALSARPAIVQIAFRYALPLLAKPLPERARRLCCLPSYTGMKA